MQEILSQPIPLVPCCHRLRVTIELEREGDIFSILVNENGT